MSLKTGEHQPKIQVALQEINRYLSSVIENCITMASRLTCSTVDREFEHQLHQTKDVRLVFVASPLSIQH